MKRVIRDPCNYPQSGNTFHTEFEEHIEIEKTILVNDHTELTNRDAADQHPTSAIIGLDDTIDELDTGITNVKTDVTNLNTNVTNLNTSVTNLNTDVKALNGKIDSTLSAENALSNSEIEQIIGGLTT